MEITKETLDRLRFEFGRICVQIEDFSFINEEVEIKIFLLSFQGGGEGGVRVAEFKVLRRSGVI